MPTDAYLPADYVAKEELRLEAYRRLAAVTTPAEVDDIRAEWEDRYGPVPAAGRGAADRRLPARRVPPARASATCRSRPARPASARSTLKLSEAMRLRRLARDAIYKEDLASSSCRSRAGPSPAAFLVGFLPS